jgi:hypothetical protein
VPYSEPYAIAADTDFVLFNDDLFVEGLRWMWYESKQQFAMASKIEEKWRSMVRGELGRQNGATVVSAAYDMQSTFDWPICPVGGWSGTGDV